MDALAMCSLLWRWSNKYQTQASNSRTSLTAVVHCPASHTGFLFNELPLGGSRPTPKTELSPAHLPLR